MASSTTDDLFERTPTGSTPAPEGVLSGRFRWLSIGMCLLIAISAFESLGVTTIMPIVSHQLDGAALYGFTFAGPLAVSIVGMAFSGAWCDRRSPRRVLLVSIGLFAVGSALVAAAPSMLVFIVGRLIHALGGGAMTVAFYVVVARRYPSLLHPKIFAGFAAAWVVPSLVGPLLAGILAETLGWRWVFLGALALAVVASVAVEAGTRGVPGPIDTAATTSGVGRLISAFVLAVAILVIASANQWVEGATVWVVNAGALLVVAVVVKRLLPVGTLRARTGLPSVILLRALIAGTFFAAEVYLPLLLVSRFGFSPAVAGLALTAGGLSWALASWWQGRSSLNDRLTVRLGLGGLSLALVSVSAVALDIAPPGSAIVGWGLAGAGMGVLYPRLEVLTLEYSTAASQGFNSSAGAIADAVCSPITLVLASVAFAALGPAAGGWQFVAAQTPALALVLIAWLVGPRIRR